MDASEINDQKTLESWLQTRPQGDSAVIAYRAALRVAPVWFVAVNADRARKRDLSALPILRLNLTSGVARKYPTPEVRRAASAAATSAAASAAASRAVSAVSAFAAASRATSASATTFAAASAAASRASASAFASASAASRASASASAANLVWAVVKRDCIRLDAGEALDGIPLWHDQPNPLQDHWDKTRANWTTPNSPYAFWARWYDAALHGQTLTPELERDIALIPDEDWEKGAKHIAGRIADLEAQDSANQAPSEIDTALVALPVAPPPLAKTVQSAIRMNREALPPTFDAIEGLIQLEIERLQSRNYQSEDEAQECKRQIAIFAMLHDAIARMRATIPETGEVSLPQAAEVEKLSRLYMRRLCDLPRSKADEVVDGVWATGKGILQVGLIGATTSTLMVSFGLPALAAVAVGTMIFAPKMVPDVVKAGIEIAKNSTKP